MKPRKDNNYNVWLWLCVSIAVHLFVVAAIISYSLISAYREKQIFMSMPIEVAFYGAQPQADEPKPVETKTPPIIDLTKKAPPAAAEPPKKDDITVKKADDKKKPEPAKNNKAADMVKKPDTAPVPAPASTAPDSDLSAPFTNVQLENKDFKYPYYLKTISRRINQNWQWVKTYGKLRAVIVFKIARDGLIFDISLRESSGDDSFDKTALRAVERAGFISPLPQEFEKEYLEVGFEFIN